MTDMGRKADVAEGAVDGQLWVRTSYPAHNGMEAEQREGLLPIRHRPQLIPACHCMIEPTADPDPTENG
ncbi:hypothetical protein [Methylocella sp.]|uniref:hypothetical protein n=1 Tax=Methylocella sp. TaxID=1978226 RepID=UPI003783B30C